MVNSIFINNHYYNIVKEGLVDKVDKSSLTKKELVEKSQKIFESFTSSRSPCQFPKDCPQSFKREILSAVREILTLAPGRELITNILKFKDKQIQLIPLNAHFCFSLKEKCIYLTPQHDVYDLYCDNRGKKWIQKVPLSVALAHELVHALNYLNDPELQRCVVTNGLLDKEFDNQEEQYTICGIERVPKNPKEIQFNSICQNSFNMGLGYRLRVNHKGLLLPKGEEPTLCDLINMDADGSVIELLVRQPDLIHVPHKVHKRNCDPEELQDKILTPLAIAFWKDRLNMIELLLQRGVKFGSPEKIYELFNAAIGGRSFKAACFLLDRISIPQDLDSQKKLRQNLLKVSDEMKLVTEYSMYLSDMKDFSEKLQKKLFDLFLLVTIESQPSWW